MICFNCDYKQLRCVDCGKQGTLSMQVDKTSKKVRTVVRFRVDCTKCGSFSHFLKSTEINRAVAQYLENTCG